MRRHSTTLAALLTSAAMLGTVAAVGLALDPTVAEANNGNGNGSNEERGNSGERGNSAQARANNGNGNGRGAIASELKNLNALCANENAFANAADDSNIGQIRAYQTASANIAQYEGAALDVIQMNDMTDLNDDNVATLIDSYNSSISTLQEQIATAQAENPEADVVDLQTTLNGQIASLNALTAYQSADGERDAALMVATRGRTLSPEAQAYLDAGCQR